MKQSLRIYIIGLLACITVVAVAWLLLRPAIEESGVETVATNENVVSTKAVLDSIRSIGQWELMSIDVQADVDTVQSRWFGLRKERLQRRYHGRISLGINMQDCTDLNNLPPASVLDTNFIDESQTELIICENEAMEQDPKLKAAMLNKARRMMLRDAATQQRLNECEQKAKNEINRILNK